MSMCEYPNRICRKIITCKSDVTASRHTHFPLPTARARSVCGIVIAGAGPENTHAACKKLDDRGQLGGTEFRSQRCVGHR